MFWSITLNMAANLKKDFTNFTMQVASSYVKGTLLSQGMKDHEVAQSTEVLSRMFNGSISTVSELFQLVVYNVVGSKHFKSQIFANGKWIDHEWSVQAGEKIPKSDKSVANMKPNVLYYPEDLFFSWS